MDDHKLVMISIFLFSKHQKYAIFFNENMLGNILGFGRTHEKIYFFEIFRKKLGILIPNLYFTV
jgi:hypothetical protein